MKKKLLTQEEQNSTLIDMKIKIDSFSIRTKPVNQPRISTPSANNE